MIRYLYEWARSFSDAARRSLVVVSLALAVPASTAGAAIRISFGPTAALDLGAAAVTGHSPDITTDRLGTYLASWWSWEAGGCVTARSTDAGRSWTPPVFVADTSCKSLVPRGQGEWLAFLNGPGIPVLLSTDNGETWSPLTLVHSSTTREGAPSVATDGVGNWMVVWSSYDSLGGTIGSDLDILYARSSDDGLTWSTPLPLNPDAATDPTEGQGSLDGPADIATNGRGTWIATWEDTAMGKPNRVVVKRSTDAGATWSAPLLLGTEGVGNFRPHIATDGTDTWVLVWVRDEWIQRGNGSEGDIMVARSLDDGLTWSEPAHLDPAEASDHGRSNDSEFVRIATDRAGTWIATWSTTNSLAGTVKTPNFVFSQSFDAGATWTSPVAVSNVAAHVESGIFFGAATVATDSNGNWVVVWESSASAVGTLGYIGNDWDIMFARASRECPLTPAPGCSATAPGTKSRLRIVDGRGGHDRISWQWVSGAGIDASEFGDPSTSTNFVLCLYDSSGNAPALVWEKDVEAGVLCGDVPWRTPCWETASDEFNYKDTRLSRGAVKRVRLRGGSSRKGRIEFLAKGPTLAPPVLPLSQATSVVVQFHNLEQGSCWNATYTEARQNTDRRFKAVLK